MVPLIDVDAVAELLGVSGRTVRRLVARGVLPAHRIGGQLRFDPVAVAGFVESARVVPDAPCPPAAVVARVEQAAVRPRVEGVRLGAVA